MSTATSMTNALLLAPPAHRPITRRQTSLQPVRVSPYPSPMTSPTLSSAGPVKRPGAPRRSHSFCADSQGSTYALASTSAASGLSKDKRFLIAPPLERTLSSYGQPRNQSQQMYRPFSTPRIMQKPGSNDESRQTTSRLCSPERPATPSTSVPTILISSSATPPRPKFIARASSSAPSSRESSPVTPETEPLLFFQPSIEKSKDNVDSMVEAVTELRV